MPANPPVQSPAKLIRLIHLALVMGVGLMAVTMVALRMTGGGPPASAPATQGLLLSGIGVVAIAISLAIMRPRVAARGSTESPDEYWNESRRGGAVIVWALIEGGGLLSVVGYILTNTWTPLGVAAISIIALILTRPGTFDGGAS